MKTHLPNSKIMSALTYGDKGIFNVRQLTIALNSIKGVEISEDAICEVVRAKGAHGSLMFDIAYLLGIDGYYPKGHVLEIEPSKSKKFRANLTPKKWTDKLWKEQDLEIHETPRSNYRGVSWHRADKKWQVQISIAGRSWFIGVYDCEHKAAKAWNVRAAKIGRRLNIIEDET